MKATPQATAIAHYRILETLGVGGMGAVYKAYDEKLHRVVALKVLPPEAISQEDRRRFLQEARAASALNHPHILTVYEVGEDDGKPYMVMEYVEGETLRQKIASRALDVKEALDIGDPSGRGTRQSPRARHHSPRPEAGEFDHQPGRLREDSGLRLGEARRAARARTRRR
ncbi:MAG: serine/threonine-protein kinase [Pyrinomonadaceae bacterium]